MYQAATRVVAVFISMRDSSSQIPAGMVTEQAITRKRPRQSSRFCYGRVPQLGGSVVYRLFRRDQTRRVYAETLVFHPDCSRREIAQRLRIVRHKLRDRVDEIDLALMGVTQ